MNDNFNPLFAAALGAARDFHNTDYGLIEFAEGQTAALVLASVGVPVVRLPIGGGQPMSPPTKNPEEIADIFPQSGCWVGFSLPRSPFYFVLSTCRWSLLGAPTSNRNILQLRRLIAREWSYPPSPRHRGLGLALPLRRLAGDSIDGFYHNGTLDMEGATLFLAAPSASSGSRLTSTGFMPVPNGLVTAIAVEPPIARMLKGLAG